MAEQEAWRAIENTAANIEIRLLGAGDRRRRVVGAADRAPAARGDRTGGTLSTEARTRPVEPDDVDRDGHSLVTALGGTLLALIIGGTVALVVTLTDIRPRNVYVFCSSCAAACSSSGGTAWLQLFGPSSRS